MVSGTLSVSKRNCSTLLSQSHDEPFSNLCSTNYYKLLLLHLLVRELAYWKAAVFIDRFPLICLRLCYHKA
jgi:hypothetical protein